MKNVFSRLWGSAVVMTWGNLAIKSSSLLLILPLVLSKFEPQDIVVWYVFVTIIGIQMILDLGFTPTLSRLISYAYGGASIQLIEKMTLSGTLDNIPNSKKPNYKAITSIFATSRLIYIFLAIIAFLISGVVGTWFVEDTLNSSSAPFESWFGWWIILCIASFTLFGNTYVSFLQGAEKIALVQRGQMFFSIAAVLSATAALVLDQSVVVAVLSYYLWSVFNVFFNIFYTRLFLNNKKESIIDFVLLKRVVFPISWKTGLGVLFSLGLIQFSALFVTKYSPPAVAASYMFALQIVRAASSFSQAPFYSKLPVLSKLYVQDNMIKFQEIANSSMIKSVFAYCMIILVISVFGNYFISFIGSNILFPDSNVWFILSLAFLFERVGALYLQLFTLTGKVVWHIVNGIAGILMVGLSFLLYDMLSIFAFPVSMLFSYFFFYNTYSVYKSYQAFNAVIGGKAISVIVLIFIILNLLFTSSELFG